MTFTRTHVYVDFVNPFLVCEQCGQPVHRWHSHDKCGCNATFWNEPCQHTADVTSLCLSWSPIDGCTCRSVLGKVDHA
ncbi:hypothetical protein [Streptomyces rochei]|uniref:hypothetical protein n=1 Tax=Streptomyces rochei TaxID=1928 RepID=UPI003676DB71